MPANHLEVLSVWSEPLQKSLQQPNELQTHRTLDSARGMMNMPGLVHALTSGMTGKCHRTKGFRFYHYSHYVSCNFFPPYYCSSWPSTGTPANTEEWKDRVSAIAIQLCLCCSWLTNHEQVSKPPTTHLPHLENGYNGPSSPIKVLRTYVDIGTFTNLN